MRPLLALPAAALLAACAGPPAPACAPTERAAVNDRLYFGLARPGGEVSAAEWADFLAGTVAPRFPQGFTVWPAAGQWLSPRDGVVREPSQVLELVRPPGAEGDRAVQEIAEANRRRFQQEAVLRLRSATCMSL